MIVLILLSFFKCLLATTSDPLSSWFQACARKDFETIKSFGSTYLYEKHQEGHYPKGKRNREIDFVGQNCYQMILFSFGLKAKNIVILNYLVGLRMPIDDYHFQVVKTEEDLRFLVDTAEERGQELDYPSLLCLASAGGWIHLFERFRKSVSSADVVGEINSVYWLPGRPFCRRCEKLQTTPILMAVGYGQLEMIDYLICHQKVQPNPEFHPLRDALLKFWRQENAEKIIQLLVTCGWDLEAWETLCNHIGFLEYKMIVENGHDKVVEQGLRRRQDLIAELRNLFTFFKGREVFPLVSDVFQAIGQTLLNRGYYGSEIVSCLNHI